MNVGDGWLSDFVDFLISLNSILKISEKYIFYMPKN